MTENEPRENNTILTQSTPRGKKVEHPYHGSESGINFKVDTDEETFRCWRHDVTGNAHHLLGMEAGVFQCGEWETRQITSDEWTEVYNYGRKQGYEGIPKKAPQHESMMSMQERADEYEQRMNEWCEAHQDDIKDSGNIEDETPGLTRGKPPHNHP